MLVGVIVTPTSPASATHSVLLDVDGTLIDSFPGIREGFIRGLEAVGAEIPSEEFIARIPGPPMRESMKSVGLRGEELERAMSAYSDYMSGEGWKRFSLFDGVAEAVRDWHDEGIFVSTATSKSERFARLALERAGILKHIDFLGAANFDAGRLTKVEVISYVLEHAAPPKPLMIGDRKHDYHGAAEFSLPSVAVTWGYGTEEEWADATYIAHNADELREVVANHVRG